MKSRIFSFPKKSKSSVGIELGGHSIKMVETREAGGRIHLLSYGVAEIPREKKGKAARHSSSIAPLIKQLLSRCVTSSPAIYFSISGPSVSIQRLKFPPMPDNELLPAIRWRGKKQFPFSLDESYVVYKKLAAPSPETKDVELFAAAALSTFIGRELSLFEQAGSAPDGIAALPFAIQSAFTSDYTEYRDKTVAFLDIGAEETTISIMKGGELQSVREIAAGGNDFTRALMEPFTVEGKHFALSFEEAEETKRSYGVPVGGGQGTTPQGIPLSRVMFIVRPILERLITEALRSFDSYKAQAREKRIDRIFLCGGGAGLKNLSEFLSSGLGIEVSLFNPFAHVVVPQTLQHDDYFQQNRHALAVALGVSTGHCRDINFLPPQPGILETVQLRNWIPLLVFIIFFFSLATVYMRSYWSVDITREELQHKASELASLKVYMDEMIKLNVKRENIKQRLSQFPDFSLEQPPFSDILVSLTHMFPDNAAVSRIALEKEKRDVREAAAATVIIKLRIEGIVFGEDAQVFAALLQITRDLERGPFFQNVMLVSSEKASDLGSPASRFVLECPLKMASFINYGL